MLTLNQAKENNIYLFKAPVRMNLSFNGLINLVLEHHNHPQDGSFFLFINKAKDRIKILYFDRTGFAIWYKRLEKDRYHWPIKLRNKLQITHQELQWLLQGIDFTMVKVHKPFEVRNIS